jgi:hypothetical protein
MTSDRKKPTAGFWITVTLVVVLVGYPLSLGPYVCFIWATDAPDWITDPCGAFYEPLDRASRRGPPWIRRNFEEYENWWLDLGEWIGKKR